MVKIIPHASVITKAPLTADAREALIEEVFAESLPHFGDIFIPDDTFYTTRTGPDAAKHMVHSLCVWLGIKPGYIGLEFEASDEPPPDGRRYTIYIETDILWDEFLLGALLAYALTRYLIEERGQIRLSSSDQQTVLATASILFGLGLIIMNGIATYGWFDRIIRWWSTEPVNLQEWSPLFKANYASSLKGFLKSRGITPQVFSFSLSPWALKKLHASYQSKPTRAIHDMRHDIRLAHLKLAGLLWILIMVIAIMGITIHSRAQSLPSRLQDAQEQVDLRADLVRKCKEDVGYKQQYADLTDIQTVRSINALELRCESLENQYEAALRSLTQ